ncbi:MAG TPA: MBG domain-containing protein [Candidatus Paceibacterota bacterium]|nr:MBG domain-containing protein [Candidatus Paceibacterota bacterium]
MKYTGYVVALVALLFIGSPVAWASVASAPNPSTTPLPFSVTCDPYTAPFVVGGSYAPTNGGTCTYTIPQTGSYKVIGIYKGTIGNATEVNVGFVQGSPYFSFISYPNSFGTPNPGDTYFAAAYSGSTLSDALVTDTYLTTGQGTTSPDLTTIPWQWPRFSLTVTADNQSMVQGASLPTFTSTLSGFVAPDTASSNDVTGSAQCTTTATSASTLGTYPITCTAGTLVSANNYAFTFVPGTLTITPAPVVDTTPPSVTITSPLQYSLYAKTNTVFLTATVTDQSPIAHVVYWLNGTVINPAAPLPLSSAPTVSKASVVATDSYGNTATSTVTFFVVKSTNSCLIDIVSVLTTIAKDKTLPNKPTILNLIADCSALLRGLHHN